MQFDVTGLGLQDLRATNLFGFTGLSFATTGDATAQVNVTQFSPTFVTFDGSSFRDVVEVFMNTASFNFSGLTLNTWTDGQDRFVIRDSAVNNTITGTSGNDWIYVTAGIDTVDGGAGTDDILYLDYSLDLGSFSSTNAALISDNSDTSVAFSNFERMNISLGSGNDNITTGSGDDVLDGGAGNDTLNGGAGAATVRGGLGNDLWVADYLADSTVKTINLNLTGLQIAGNGTSYRDLERLNFAGGSGNDVITTRTDNANDGRSDTLNGGVGDDTLTVGGGVDTVIGGDGDDLLIVDYSTESSGMATSGNSITDFSNTAVTFSGIERFDYRGGSGTDNITTGAGNDTLTGGAGNDTLNSGAGIAVIDGGADTDLWISDFSSDGTAKTINLSLAGVQAAGNGTTYANFERLNFTGGSGNDVITSRTDNANDGRSDTLNGGFGDDTLTVGGGIDSVIGGDGDDLLIVDYSTETSNMLTSSNNFSDFSNTAVNFTDIERFDVTGGSGNDSFVTLGGNDTLRGGAGNDSLNSGAGIAVIDGGADTDLWTSDFSSDGTAKTINVNLAGVQAAGNGTTYANIERLNFTGGSGNDVITSRTDNANDGRADTLNGGGGNDTLTVGGGVDNVIGGDGDDLLIVDYTTETNGQFSNGGSFTDFSNTAVIFSGIERFDFRGGAGNDSITLGTGNDTFRGGLGNDTSNGGGGSDTFTFAGQTTRVTLTIDAANGAVIFGRGSGTDTATQYETYILSEGNDNGTGNLGNDAIFGGLGRDRLRGGGGDDTLVGGGGADRIEGGDGKDLMTGGVAADTFEFTARGQMNRLEADADIITDFAINLDKIDLVLIDAIPDGAFDNFVWMGTAAFTGLGQVRTYNNGVDTFVALNTAGGFAADYTIRLNGLITLAETDFILV